MSQRVGKDTYTNACLSHQGGEVGLRAWLGWSVDIDITIGKTGAWNRQATIFGTSWVDSALHAQDKRGIQKRVLKRSIHGDCKFNLGLIVAGWHFERNWAGFGF